MISYDIKAMILKKLLIRRENEANIDPQQNSQQHQQSAGIPKDFRHAQAGAKGASRGSGQVQSLQDNCFSTLLLEPGKNHKDHHNKL